MTHVDVARWRRPANLIHLNRNRGEKATYGRCCAVGGCYNCQGLGHTLNLFQRENSTLRKWVNFVKMAEQTLVLRYSSICDQWCTFCEWVLLILQAKNSWLALWWN